MAFGYQQYERAGNEVASPREMEAKVFTFVTRNLTEAAAGSDAPRRIRALHNNHKLWSLLVKDLSLSGNALPEDLKRNIVRLAFWAMRYSTKAIAEPLELEPLITVNQQMIEALTTQAPSVPTASASVRVGAITA